MNLFIFALDLSSDDEGESEPEGLDETSIIGLIDVVCIIFSVNKGKFKASPNNILWGNIKARYNKTCSIFFRYFKVAYLFFLSFFFSICNLLFPLSNRKDFGHSFIFTD